MVNGSSCMFPAENRSTKRTLWKALLIKSIPDKKHQDRQDRQDRQGRLGTNATLMHLGEWGTLKK